MPARTHFASGTSQSGSAHVLDTDNRSCLHGFKASLEQKLFHEWIAYLHIGTLRFRSFAELFAGHGRAVNPIAPSFRANVNYRIANARSLRIKNLIPPHQTKRKRVYQRIARVATFKLRFAAQIRHAKTIPIRSHATNNTLKHRMILMNLGLRCLSGADTLVRGL